jgi:hypothetical protein
MGLVSRLPTNVGTAEGCARAEPSVGSSDYVGTTNDQGLCTTRREFRLTSGLPTLTVSKSVLCARRVLECLSYDLVLILEHSIFLRPTKFCIPLYSTTYLNPKTKELTLKLRFEFDAFFNFKNLGIPFHLYQLFESFMVLITTTYLIKIALVPNLDVINTSKPT